MSALPSAGGSTGSGL